MIVNYFLIILFLNLLFSVILQFVKYKSKRICKLPDYKKLKRDIWIIENHSFITKLILIILYTFNDMFDVFSNFLEFLYPDNKKKYFIIFDFQSAIDLLVLLYFAITWVFWYFLTSDCFIKYIDIIAAFCLYRILYVLIRKLLEIFIIGRKGDIGNITNIIRTFVLSIFNLFEIVMGFSILYFATGVFTKNNIDSIFFTLNLFTTMGVNTSINICDQQKQIILFQLIVFFIYITIFITNIANLKYFTKTKKKLLLRHRHPWLRRK